MTDRKNNLVFFALILAALVGALLVVLPQSPWGKEPTLGLDLQGGLEVVLEAVPQKGQELTDEDLDRAVNIIRDRIDALGVTEPDVRKQQPNQIVIQLAGITDTSRALALIGKTAQMEMYDLETSLVGPSISQNFPVANENLFNLLSSAATRSLVDNDEQGNPSAYYLFKDKKLVAGPLPSAEALLETEKGKEAGTSPDDLGKGYRLLSVPGKAKIVRCTPQAVVCPGVNEVPPTQTYYYLFRFQPTDAENPIPQMTGADLKLDGTRQDFDTSPGGGGRAIVTLQFTDRGADRFGEITRAEAQRGKLLTNLRGGGDKITQHFAIVLDEEIRSWPQIDWETYPNGISGSNGAQITGLDSLQEAKDLALVLQTGALPVDFRQLTATTVSATLGEDSLREAELAAIGGLAIVALFLILFYRVLGVIAVAGLAIYGVFLYAAILLFGVTLTLPGFAGMILTIGVAADANVVIFERIKEEARAGKSVRAAVAAGYGKGFATIVDANVITAITALVLFAVATGGVRGFALFLLIGTVMSIVTAVFATRAMLGLIAGFKWFSNPRFMGAEGAVLPKFLQIDFIGLRKVWFGIAGAIVAISLGSIILNGLNLGIDFKGGTQLTFDTPQPQLVEDVRRQAERVGKEGAQVQGRGDAVGAERYRQFTIRMKEITPQEQARLTTALENQLDVSSIEVKNVSGSFGRQIAQSAVLAILFSLALIVVYIIIRFPGWKFALPVLAALVHDILVTVGVYSLTGREVTASTVAAILTVLGYSMYDTVIIFDRIRENLHVMRRSAFSHITNVSIWETLVRSLATTFITLLPVASILFFGGETLKDFALALLIGIGSGAYSTIFIASPLLAMLKEREPEFAQRRGAIAERGVGSAGAVSEPTLAEAEGLAAEEPVPELAPVTDGDRAVASDRAERRRQRRKTRPHGRAR